MDSSGASALMNMVARGLAAATGSRGPSAPGGYNPAMAAPGAMYPGAYGPAMYNPGAAPYYAPPPGYSAPAPPPPPPPPPPVFYPSAGFGGPLGMPPSGPYAVPYGPGAYYNPGGFFNPGAW